MALNDSKPYVGHKEAHERDKSHGKHQLYVCERFIYSAIYCWEEIAARYLPPCVEQLGIVSQSCRQRNVREHSVSKHCSFVMHNRTDTKRKVLFVTY